MLLWLLLLGAALAAPSDWRTSEIPLGLAGLSIGAPAERVPERLGRPEREIDPDLKLYPGGLLVRTREGRVVNLTSAGAWSLRQGERELAAAGQPLPEGLGSPNSRYRRAELLVHLYRVQTADLGVLTSAGLIQGFLLAEPGLLGWALEQSGYRLEDP